MPATQCPRDRVSPSGRLLLTPRVDSASPSPRRSAPARECPDRSLGTACDPARPPLEPTMAPSTPAGVRRGPPQARTWQEALSRDLPAPRELSPEETRTATMVADRLREAGC